MIRASYAFLELCYRSQDVAIRHVAVVSFAEALGDSDSLQAAAAAHVQPQVCVRVRVFHCSLTGRHVFLVDVGGLV
eukprot:1153154-Pelagomonas_calceolata.AAC.6